MTVLDPIVQSVTIEADQQRTFDTFVDRIATWWPVDTHALAPGQVADVRVERRLGGRLYERHHDGSEADWGHITVWQPYDRLAFTWEVIPGPAYTEVELRFQRLGPALTRVSVTHRGWERLAPELLDRYDGYAGGWPTVLARFEELFTRDGRSVAGQPDGDRHGADHV